MWIQHWSGKQIVGNERTGNQREVMGMRKLLNYLTALIFRKLYVVFHSWNVCVHFGFECYFSHNKVYISILISYLNIDQWKSHWPWILDILTKLKTNLNNHENKRGKNGATWYTLRVPYVIEKVNIRYSNIIPLSLLV